MESYKLIARRSFDSANSRQVRMTTTLRGLLRAAGLTAAFTAACYGSAFSIAQLGARAAGMGTAFIATADDGSAIYFNPAGIAFQPGRKMQMDSLVVVGLFRYTPTTVPVGQVVPPNGYSGSVKPKFIPVASLYMTQQYNEKITLGFGVFTPFGLAANFTNFNDSDPNLTKYPGRFAGTRAQLQSYWFQPTIAYKLTPNQSIALGPAFVHTHLFLEQSILNPLDDGLEFGRLAAKTFFPGVNKEQAAAVLARLLPEGRSRVAGTANSPAFSAGWLYKRPDGKVRFGLMYRSAVTNHLKGQASFAFGNDYAVKQYIGEDFLFKAFPNQPVTGSFTTPATYGAGFATSRFWDMTIAADVRIQDYKRFKSVPLNFPYNEDISTKDDIALPAEQRLIFDFNTSVNVAFGVEKALSPSMTVRAGYMFDRSPVPDKSVGPLFPDSNRNSFTVGASRKRGNKEFTIYYEAMKFENRVTNVPANNKIYTNGEYKNFAHLAGLALRFNLGDLAMIKKR